MTEPGVQQLQKHITLIDSLIVIVKRKRIIAWITLSSIALAIVISLLMPKTYRAETRILPPQQSSSGTSAQLLNQLSGLGGSAGLIVGMKTPNDLYVGLLKSRTVLDRIIDRFNLLAVYKTDYREDARRDLLNALNVRDDRKSGIITIGVEDRKPQRSADMTNAFVEELKNLTQYIAVTEASQRRLFFEEQLKSVKEALIRAEDSLRGYQEKTGAIEIREQTKAVIESVAHLRAQISAKEVELKVLKTYATSRNPDLQKIEEELTGMQEQLAKLESRGGGSPDALMPTGRMPEAGTGYVRKIRDMKYYETLYELLSKQYEIAKMDEARDAAVIPVIDPAVPPERKLRPKRSILVILVALTGLLLSVIAAFVQESWEDKASRPGVQERIEKLRQYASFRNKQ